MTSASVTRRSSDKPANRYRAKRSRHRVLQCQMRRTELDGSRHVPSARTKQNRALLRMRARA